VGFEFLKFHDWPLKSIFGRVDGLARVAIALEKGRLLEIWGSRVWNIEKKWPLYNNRKWIVSFHHFLSQEGMLFMFYSIDTASELFCDWCWNLKGLPFTDAPCAAAGDAPGLDDSYPAQTPCRSASIIVRGWYPTMRPPHFDKRLGQSWALAALTKVKSIGEPTRASGEWRGGIGLWVAWFRQGRIGDFTS
jgi:hypothetical protein